VLLLAVIITLTLRWLCCCRCCTALGVQGWLLLLSKHCCLSIPTLLLLLLLLLQLPQQLPRQAETNACSHSLQQLQLA
jgi:hypothetical protein